MRVEVGAINKISGVTLAGVAACYVYKMFITSAPGAAAPVGFGVATHCIIGYVLTTLSFLAFPRTRRVDLVKVVVLVAALVEIANAMIGRNCEPNNIIADGLGALAVLVPSMMERFRALVRADPNEPLSFVYPAERRRSDRRRSKAPLVAR